MNYICDKCFYDAPKGSHVIEWGELYHFCRKCSDVLDKLPSGSVEKFVNGNIDLSEEDQNMINARIKRKKILKSWQKVNGKA